MGEKWWEHRTPDQIEPVPFWHPAVSLYLTWMMQPDFVVVEHGSGGSTLWLAQFAQRVISYESDQAWYDALNAIKPANVTLRFSDDGGVPANVPVADVLIIDGMPLRARREWITAAPEIVRPGGIILLDNANRPDYMMPRQWLIEHTQAHITLDCNPPGGRYLVTDIYLTKGGSREWI